MSDSNSRHGRCNGKVMLKSKIIPTLHKEDSVPIRVVQ
jgi:hypothetical protein